jgi:hypothetical protein
MTIKSILDIMIFFTLPSKGFITWTITSASNISLAILKPSFVYSPNYREMTI